jgi:glycosidase
MAVKGKVGSSAPSAPRYNPPVRTSGPWLLLLLLLGCGAGPAQPPIRDCSLVIRAPGADGGVFLRGEWSAFALEAMSPRSDGTWEWKATLDARSQGYAYAFVADDGGLALDPRNAFERWVGDARYSRLFAPDCAAPTLEVTAFTAGAAGGLRVAAQASRGSSGAALEAPVALLDGQPATATWNAHTGALTLARDGLASGKHTLTFDLRDARGASAEHVYLPFWVEPTPFSWQDALLYFTLTDRFLDADPSNDAPAPMVTAQANYEGGDFRGITQKITDGYFDALGVRALWLSPLDQNPDDGWPGSYNQSYAGYHGYWPSAPRTVQPRFGSLADLQALTSAAHAHGIRVIADLVLNHVHQAHPYFAQHRDDGWFNTGQACVCGAPGCSWDDKPLVCWFTPYLPDYNWRSTSMADQVASDVLWWVEQGDLDGFRLDAVKHYEHAGAKTVSGLLHRIESLTGTHSYLVGETFTGTDGRPLVAQYLGANELDGQFDFPLYWPVIDAFARGLSLKPVDAAVQASEAFYPPGTLNSPFLGNHDVPRFASIAAGQIESDAAAQAWGNRPPEVIDADLPYQRLIWAFTFLLTQPGVPLIYYGDEIAMPGAGDPDNRRPMRFDGLSARQQALLAKLQKLGQARQRSLALRRGARQTLVVEDDFYAWARGSGANVAWVAVNRGSAPRTLSVTLDPAITRLTEVFSSAQVSATGGAMQLTVPAEGQALWVPSP